MNSDVQQYNDYRYYKGIRVHLETIERTSLFSVIPNLSTGPSSSGARKPIYVAISIDLPRKK
jgi:hypothetical protein